MSGAIHDAVTCSAIDGGAFTGENVRRTFTWFPLTSAGQKA